MNPTDPGTKEYQVTVKLVEAIHKLIATTENLSVSVSNLTAILARVAEKQNDPR
jgi:hypothetical protein